MSKLCMPLRLPAAMIALCAVLSSPPALAESPKTKPAAGPTEADSEARRLFKEGDKLYAEGDYEGAVRAFEKSYELSQQPALQYNLANAYERLGRYDDGVKALQAYEPHAAGDEREVVRRRIKKLQERAEQQRKEAPAATPPSNSDTPAAPAISEAPAGPGPAEDKATSSGPPVAGYVLLGVGAVGIGVGSFLGLKALSSKSDAEKLCPNVAGKRTCPATADETLSSNTRNAVLADIGFGVGIAALAVGGYLLFSGGKAKETTAMQLQPSAGPRGGGFSLIGTF
jgi:hypothetical protein